MTINGGGRHKRRLYTAELSQAVPVKGKSI